MLEVRFCRTADAADDDRPLWLKADLLFAERPGAFGGYLPKRGCPMTFLYHQVASPLSDSINFLYAVHGAMPYERDVVFPTASTDFKINLGDPWLVEDPRLGTAESLAGGWWMGIWDRHHIVSWPAETDFIGVSFKPGGAHAFIGVPMAELRNRFVPLDAIWGLTGSGIRERLGNATTVEQRFALLETFLLARWRENNEAAAIVGHVAMKIHRHHGTGRIGDLSAASGVSQKHLITLFNRLVGCTPTRLARLTRFHHALDSLDIAAPVRWTNVAYEHDFADQAHFTHDFAAYSGLTPTDYLARRLAVHAERPDHASVPWVLPAG